MSRNAADGIRNLRFHQGNKRSSERRVVGTDRDRQSRSASGARACSTKTDAGLSYAGAAFIALEVVLNAFSFSLLSLRRLATPRAAFKSSTADWRLSGASPSSLWRR